MRSTTEILLYAVGMEERGRKSVTVIFQGTHCVRSVKGTEG